MLSNALNLQRVDKRGVHKRRKVTFKRFRRSGVKKKKKSEELKEEQKKRQVCFLVAKLKAHYRYEVHGTVKKEVGCAMRHPHH